MRRSLNPLLRIAAGVAFASGAMSEARGASSTGWDTVMMGRHYLKVWTSDNFDKSQPGNWIYREWDDDLTYYKYHRGTVQGGQLAQVSSPEIPL